MDVNEMLLLHHYHPLMAAAIAKFPAEPWIALGGRGRRAVAADPVPRGGAATTMRSWPTAASPRSTIPQLGPVRQVGRVYELHACPTDAPTAPPAIGADTDDGAGRSRRGRAARRR